MSPLASGWPSSVTVPLMLASDPPPQPAANSNTRLIQFPHRVMAQCLLPEK
jgi:hypothetical protein